jgi:hypothetical protein
MPSSSTIRQRRSGMVSSCRLSVGGASGAASRAWNVRQQHVVEQYRAVDRSKPLLRRILKEHVSDDACQMPANKVIARLELSRFRIGEERQLIDEAPLEPLAR